MEASGQWQAALEDVARGISGGLLLGVPLLYTMEVWWVGETITPGRALFGLLLSIVPVFFLAASAGFRQAPDVTRLDVLIDTIVAVGLGIASVAVVLLMLQRIDLDTPLPVAVTMIVFEAAPFSVGVAVAREVFERSPDRNQQEEQGHGESGDRSSEGRAGGARATMWDLGATALGAVFIGLSIAPTEEVPMLAAAIETPWVVILMLTSLVVSYAIVFAAVFSQEEKRKQQQGVLQRPLTETVVAYLLALLVSAAMLWFFGNLEPSGPLAGTINRTIVLGLPAAIGGAAGRLVV